MRRTDLVAFLGPSLPARAARAVARFTVLPPARQGDVWRALRLRPRAIALVDGLFESEPSVWHREILDALSAGVAVFGGASMGALRAAELFPFGMVGVGEVFRAYRDGRLLDDGEVALLHAGPEHDYQAFTVPLVNVRWAAGRARSEGVLGGSEARVLVDAAERIFYMDRTWKAVLRGAARRLGEDALSRFQAFAARGLPDVKAEDARATLAAARDFAAGPTSSPLLRAPLRAASSLVRRRKISGDPLLPAVLSLPAGQRSELAEEGLRRALLAGLARSLGLASAGPARGWDASESRSDAEPSRRSRLGSRELDLVEALRLEEEGSLERLLLENAARVVPDGPSPLEGLVSQARRLWGRSPRVRRARSRRPRVG